MEIEIILERIKREFNLELISTPPFSILRKGEKIITNPKELDINLIYEEQFIKGEIEFDLDIKDKLIFFLKNFEIEIKDKKIIFFSPLSLLDTKFYNELQNIIKGKSELKVESLGWKKSDIFIIDIHINNIPSGLRFIFHLNDYIVKSKEIVDNMAEFFSLKNFKVKIQAFYKNKSIYTHTLSARKNNVASKCYGGDYTRKAKLWTKQKEGRKKQSENFNLKGKELKNMINALKYRKK